MAFRISKSVFAVYALLLCPCALRSQPVALSLANSSGLAGDTVTAPISLNAGPNASVAALQWSLRYPASDIVSVSVAAGDAAVAVDKTVVCSSAQGSTDCLLYGMNTAWLSNGVVAEATFELATRPRSSITVELKNVVAASPDGTSLPVSGDSEAKILVVPRPPRPRSGNEPVR